MIRHACIIVIAAAGLGACATAPHVSGRDAAMAQPASPLSAKSNPGCIRSTGSHIKPPKGQCLDVPGTSYSGEQLKRTGAGNTAEALRMLDPAVH